MLDTTQLCHIAFLDGIKKEYTGTVSPTLFYRIWNDWAQPEWVSQNLSEQEGVELTEKQIDDLASITHLYTFKPVYTDSYQRYFPLPDGLAPLPVEEYQNTKVTGPPIVNTIFTPPKYLRQLAVRFKLEYGPNQVCDLTGYSDFQWPWYQKAINRASCFASKYRRPCDARIRYMRMHRTKHATINFDLVDGVVPGTAVPIPNGILNYWVLFDHIEMIIGDSDSKAYRMELQYLTYPLEVSDSVNSDLPFFAKKEIVEIAVRLYLERVKDQRYQTFFQHEMVNRNTKI